MKTIKYLAMAAVVAIAGMAMTSCGGGDYSNDKAKEMMLKNDEGKLTEEDYNKMVQWLIEEQTEQLDNWEKVINDNPDYKDYYFANKEFEQDHSGKYLYIDEITAIVVKESGSKTFGKENKEQLEKAGESLQKRAEALSKKVPEKK